MRTLLLSSLSGRRNTAAQRAFSTVLIQTNVLALGQDSRLMQLEDEWAMMETRLEARRAEFVARRIRLEEEIEAEYQARAQVTTLLK